MRIMKLRYALVGWLVTKLARRRLERRLHALAVHAGHARRRII